MARTPDPRGPGVGTHNFSSHIHLFTPAAILISAEYCGFYEGVETALGIPFDLKPGFANIRPVRRFSSVSGMASPRQGKTGKTRVQKRLFYEFAGLL